MRDRILAEQSGPSKPFMTSDVARAVGVTDEGVRHLVREEQLACTRTPAGWRVFRKGDVLRLVEQRAEARLKSVTRLRAKKIGPRDGPRQLSLFSPVREVAFGAQSLGKSQVNGVRSGRKKREADNHSNVTRRRHRA